MEQATHENLIIEAFLKLVGPIEHRANELGIPIVFQGERKSGGGVPDDAPYLCASTIGWHLPDFTLPDVTKSPLVKIDDYLLSLGNAMFNLAAYVRTMSGSDLQTGVFLATDPKTHEVVCRSESSSGLSHFVRDGGYPCNTYFYPAAIDEIAAILDGGDINLLKAEPYQLDDCVVTLAEALRQPHRKPISDSVRFGRVHAFQIRVATAKQIADLNKHLAGVADLRTMGDHFASRENVAVTEDQLNLAALRFTPSAAGVAVGVDLRSDVPRTVANKLRERAGQLCRAADQIELAEWHVITAEERINPKAYAIYAMDGSTVTVVDQSYDFDHMAYRAHARLKEKPGLEFRVVEEAAEHCCRAFAMYNEQLCLLSLPVQIEPYELIPEYFVVETDSNGDQSFPFSSAFRSAAETYVYHASQSQFTCRPDVLVEVKHRRELERPVRKRLPKAESIGVL